MNYSAAIDNIRPVLYQIGERIRSVLDGRSSVEVMHKGEVDLVTEVDLWSEKLLISHLRSSFPDHKILGEEESSALDEKDRNKLFQDSKQGFCWVLDPVDGTTNFAHRIPHVGVSIGLLHDSKSVAGMVLDPARDELFTAIRGKGAFCNDKPIRASLERDLIKAVVATGVPYDKAENWPRYAPVYEAFLRRTRDLRRFGAATIDQCWVASGKFDAFFEYQLKPWDVAAASLIVEEAGGIANHFHVQQKTEFDPFEATFLFSACSLFEEMHGIALKAHSGPQDDL